MSTLRVPPAALIASVVILLAGCGASGDLTPSQVQTSQEQETFAEEVIDQEEEAVETVEVVVVSFFPGNAVTWMNENFGRGPGSCALAMQMSIDQAGHSVELTFGDEFPPMVARFEPSPFNGDELPCTMQATFADVPVGAKIYEATQIGGTASPGLFSRSVSETELKQAGYQIVTVEKES